MQSPHLVQLALPSFPPSFLPSVRSGARGPVAPKALSVRSGAHGPVAAKALSVRSGARGPAAPKALSVRSGARGPAAPKGPPSRQDNHRQTGEGVAQFK